MKEKRNRYGGSRELEESDFVKVQKTHIHEKLVNSGNLIKKKGKNSNETFDNWYTIDSQNRSVVHRRVVCPVKTSCYGSDLSINSSLLTLLRS